MTDQEQTENPEPSKSIDQAGEQHEAGAQLPAIDMESLTVTEAANTLSGVFSYAASLRKRTLRGATAFAGAVRESSDWLVPSSFRNAQSYTIFVHQMLDYVNDVAGVRRVFSGKAAEAFSHDHADLARKTVGNLFDMTALATFPLSPITILAIYAQLAHKENVFLTQLSARLKEHAIIAQNVEIRSSDDLASAIEAASGSAAEVFDKPPIALDSLARTIDEIKSAIASGDELITITEIDQLWRQMQLAAEQQGSSMWDISATISVVALSNFPSASEQVGDEASLNLPSGIIGRELVQHYWGGLRAIEREGLISTLSTASQPYLQTIWSSFAVGQRTWSEQLLSGELLKWGWSQWSWPRLATARTDSSRQS